MNEKTWIVIAAYNESQRLPAVLNSLIGLDYQVVVVDDGSCDDTASLAAAFPVNVLKHLVNRGQGAALKTGIQFAFSQGAQAIVTFDADGQHLASDLYAILQPIQSGDADLAVGSRFLGNAPGIPWHRKLLLRAAVLFTKLTTGLRLTDAHNGLRAFSRMAAQKIDFQEDGMAHASEILSLAASHGLRLVEVPCTIQYTSDTLEKGQSNRAAFKILGRLALAKVFR